MFYAPLNFLTFSGIMESSSIFTQVTIKCRVHLAYPRSMLYNRGFLTLIRLSLVVNVIFQKKTHSNFAYSSDIAPIPQICISFLLNISKNLTTIIVLSLHYLLTLTEGNICFSLLRYKGEMSQTLPVVNFKIKCQKKH